MAWRRASSVERELRAERASTISANNGFAEPLGLPLALPHGRLQLHSALPTSAPHRRAPSSTGKVSGTPLPPTGPHLPTPQSLWQASGLGCHVAAGTTGYVDGLARLGAASSIHAN